MTRYLFLLLLSLSLTVGAALAEDKEFEKRHVKISNSIGMELVLIPAGEFTMGSSETQEELAAKLPGYETGDFPDEYPAHRVRVTKPFYLGTHEVTRGEFQRFVESTDYKTEGEKDGQGGYGWNAAKDDFEQSSKYTWLNPGFEQKDNHPVVNVSWNDAKSFCDWLSKKENKSYRLPTEAEWEYACRAGSHGIYSFGDDTAKLTKHGNVADEFLRRTIKRPDWTFADGDDGHSFTAPVGSYPPNAFGLYDMYGNVDEWCNDWFSLDYYGSSPSEDPPGPMMGLGRIYRGGSWDPYPRNCRSAFRAGFAPSLRFSSLGFRVALSSDR